MGDTTTSTPDATAGGVFSDLLATARTYFTANAAAKQANTTWATQHPLGVNENGAVYQQGQPSLGSAVTGSGALLIGGAVLAVGVLFLLLKR